MWTLYIVFFIINTKPQDKWKYTKTLFQKHSLKWTVLKVIRKSLYLSWLNFKSVTCMCVGPAPRLCRDAAMEAVLCFPRCTPPSQSQGQLPGFSLTPISLQVWCLPGSCLFFFFLIFDHVCFSKCYFTEFCLLSICQDLPCCIPVGIIYKLIESIVTLWARFKGIYPAVFECPSSESSGQDFSKPLLQEGAAWGTNSVPWSMVRSAEAFCQFCWFCLFTLNLYCLNTHPTCLTSV